VRRESNVGRGLVGDSTPRVGPTLAARWPPGRNSGLPYLYTATFTINLGRMKLMGGMLVSVLTGCGVDGRSGNVTITAPQGAGAQIAYRDGDGPWTVVSGAEAPILFTSDAGTYTVAINCDDFAFIGVDVFHLTADELSTVEYQKDCQPHPLTLSGMVVGGNNQNAAIGWGNPEGPGMFNGLTYSLPVAAGQHDLVALDDPYYAKRLWRRRDVTLATDTTIDIDLTSSEAVSLELLPVTAFGLASPTSSTVSGGYVSGGTLVTFGPSSEFLRTVPAAAMGPDDLQFVVNSRGGLRNPQQVTSSLSVSRSMPVPIPRTPLIEEVPVLSGITLADQTRISATWAPQVNAVLFRLVANGRWRIAVSPGAFAIDGVLEMPDLSSAVGWTGLTGTSTPVDWSVVAVTGVDLQDALRIVPRLEGVREGSGWAGQQTF